MFLLGEVVGRKESFGIEILFFHFVFFGAVNDMFVVRKVLKVGRYVCNGILTCEGQEWNSGAICFIQRWLEQIMQLPISRSAGAEQPSKSHARSGILNFEDGVVRG